jgi:hypothetical protein
MAPAGIGNPRPERLRAIKPAARPLRRQWNEDLLRTEQRRKLRAQPALEKRILVIFAPLSPPQAALARIVRHLHVRKLYGINGSLS